MGLKVSVFGLDTGRLHEGETLRRYCPLEVFAFGLDTIRCYSMFEFFSLDVGFG